MTQDEAQEKADRLNRRLAMRAVICRILPRSLDPVVPGDNGWDVKVIMLDDGTEFPPEKPGE